MRIEISEDEDDFVRSTSFKLPWRLSTKYYPTRYGRGCPAIVDADGAVIVLLDPSNNEYAPACSKEAAEAIVNLAFRMHGLEK
jgi:hypothetical protein